MSVRTLYSKIQAFDFSVTLCETYKREILGHNKVDSIRFTALLETQVKTSENLALEIEYVHDIAKRMYDNPSLHQWILVYSQLHVYLYLLRSKIDKIQ